LNILVTGGAGYIASHTLIALHEANYDFIVYDNLCNSSKNSLKAVEKIIGKTIEFVQGDIRDRQALQDLFATHSIDSVIHFAGLKAVGESVSNPLSYYDNNVNGTLVLLAMMKANNCKKIVFSSSATVYNEVSASNYKALEENDPTGATTNPYGTSKYMIEQILNDLYTSDNTFQIAILRYFNPVGAHESGTIGEDPNGIPNNLMPFISQTAVGKREVLSVFGGDYDTHDGTGVRDYIHVVDLANAHVKAIDYISKVKTSSGCQTSTKAGLEPHTQKEESGCGVSTLPLTVNIGTGIGYSVLDMIKAFEKASSKKVPYQIAPRRVGDIAKCYANPSLAKKLLNWEATKTIEDMCQDSWRWQSNNPDGYNHG
jgi:UDP-glucose 4-epimerase